MFGCGCVAQAVLSRNANGNMLSINVGWGLGVLIGITTGILHYHLVLNIGELNMCVQVRNAILNYTKSKKLTTARPKDGVQPTRV